MEDLQGTITKEIGLQMVVKAVNDTTGLDGLVPTLLVFGAYPHMHAMDPPAPTIFQRAAAIEKAMSEIRKLHAKRQVTDALSTQNGPVISPLHDLSLNLDVLVWQEGNARHTGKWIEPFKLLGIDNETCRVNLPSGPTEFRNTTVKPYLIEKTGNSEDVEETEDNIDHAPVNQLSATNQEESSPAPPIEQCLV